VAEYMLEYDGDEENVENGIWCNNCGEQIFYGESYYVFQNETYCTWCANQEELIFDAERVDPP